MSGGPCLRSEADNTGEDTLVMKDGLWKPIRVSILTVFWMILGRRMFQ